MKDDANEKRRDFLKKAGRFAVYTPPVLMMLMHPSMKAIAKSGGGGGYNRPGGNGGGRGTGNGRVGGARGGSVNSRIDSALNRVQARIDTIRGRFK